jgi:hypothetical protein
MRAFFILHFHGAQSRWKNADEKACACQKGGNLEVRIKVQHGGVIASWMLQKAPNPNLCTLLKSMVFSLVSKINMKSVNVERNLFLN